MINYGKESGIAVTVARIQNFRSLANIEVNLNDLTVLIGANNAGKTNFLDALFAAIGSGQKSLGSDDVRLTQGEAIAPKMREVLIDIEVRPIGVDGKVVGKYPEGSFWTDLWGTPGIAIDDNLNEFTPIRTTLKWNDMKGEFVVERKFLKEWKPFTDWTTAATHDRALSAAQMDQLSLYYVDAKRDLDEDLRKPGSFWGLLTENLGLNNADIVAIESALSAINQEIVDKSDILKHLKENLAILQNVASTDSGEVVIAPVARKLRDLSKSLDVSFNTSGAQAIPLVRHGMGMRSLASLLVFRAYVSWRNKHGTKNGNKVHSVLALEEPESHLHPQAQRALFTQIKAIPGQRIISTHSPYFAGQAQLEDLRLFIKSGEDTIVTQLNLNQLTDPNDLRKLQEMVIDTRGDLLFSRGLVLFEGQTEEQALPIWAKKYWGTAIHELGFYFVRVNGTDYFPFMWLAKALQIPWYVFADGEEGPVKNLGAALKKAGEQDPAHCHNVVVHPTGKNFESQLIEEGYLSDIEQALNEMSGSKTYLEEFIATMHNQKGKRGVIRNYRSGDGKKRAAIDALSSAKTSVSKHLAHTIASHADPARRFPTKIKALFEIISAAHDLKKAPD